MIVGLPGDNTVLLQQVSASLLKEFKDQFKPDQPSEAAKDGSATGAVAGSASKFRGMLRYLETEAAFSWQTSRANPRAQQHRTTGKRQIKDLDFYLSAFQFREGRLLRALVNRLGQKPKADSDSGASSSKGAPKPNQFDAWNQAGDLVNELARAHVDRQLIESFVDAIERVDTPNATEEEASLVPILRALCSLFALTTIQKYSGFYLTFRFFSPTTSKNIWVVINELVNKLAPASLQLVDAFGIPDAVLGAPIATDWKAAFAYPNVPGYTPVKKEGE